MFQKLIILALLICSGCSTNVNSTVQQEVKEVGNVLIAYFSWADNTIVTDEEASIQSALQHYDAVGDAIDETDAISAASVVHPGNVTQMATAIQNEIGGDLFSIQVEDTYPSDYDACLERAADEKAQQSRPTLKQNVENIDAYDTVFIGYPNWWYSIPMAIYSFIEQNDLSNKNIVLFCAHGTGGLSRSVQDIQEALPSSASLEENVIGIARSEMHNCNEIITNWLHEIGYEGEQEEMKVKLKIEEKEYEIALLDNPASTALYDRLPLHLTFEDFNQSEKISYLQDDLPTNFVQESGNVEIGDLCYYVPWGNLAFFYTQNTLSSSLIKLGYVVDGIDEISNITTNFEATLEKSE